MKKIIISVVVLMTIALTIYFTAVRTKSVCDQNWGICKIKTEKVFHSTTTIKIAIIDSGINVNSNIKGKIKKSYNFIENTSRTNDLFNHGTLIANIIASNDNNANGRGINKNVELFDAQVLDSKGSGKTKNIVKAIEWSIKNKVDIINMSFGITNEDKNLKRSLSKAKNKGIIIVAAAGNIPNANTQYPARDKNTISISAINKENKRTLFSNSGKIDYVLPGVDIVSINNKGKKELVTGTSFASAYYTGLLSLVLKDDNYSLQIKSLGDKKYYGRGLPELVISRK